MINTIRLGFIGCGNHANTAIYPAVKAAPFDLLAVCDLDVQKAIKTKERFGAKRVYVDYREMLQKEALDAVAIVINAELHNQIGLGCLQAGKHVFIEKPPAPTVADAQRMLQVSQSKHKYVMVGFMKRFASGYVMAKKLMCEKRFGQPIAFSAKFSSGPYKDDQYFLLDYAIHYFDLLHFLFGAIAEVASFYAPRKDGPGTWTLNLKFHSGVIGSVLLTAGQTWHEHTEFIEIMGEQAFIQVDNLWQVRYFRGAKPAWERRQEFDPDREYTVYRPNFTVPGELNTSSYIQGYDRELKHFAQAISLGVPPKPGIEDGIRALKLIELINRSDGKVINWADVFPQGETVPAGRRGHGVGFE